MTFLTWLAENFKNGELFFYIIPIFLFILLLLTIFLPDDGEKDEKNREEEKEAEKESKPVMVEDLSHERVKIEDVVKEEDRETVPVSAPIKEELKELKPVSLEKEKILSDREKGKTKANVPVETVEIAEDTVPEIKPETPVETVEATEEIVPEIKLEVPVESVEATEEIVPEIKPEVPVESVEDIKDLALETEEAVSKKPEVTAENIKIENAADSLVDKIETEEKQDKVPEKIEIAPKAEIPIEKPKSFKDGLSGTRGGFMSKLKNLFSSSVVDDDLIEDMEEILYTADIGVPTVSHLMAQIEKNRKNFKSGEDVRNFLKMEIYNIVETCEKELEVKDVKPFVMIMVGVNGAGKTTTIGKLTRKFKDSGKSVLLAAADTFRAAAVEQLVEWGRRTDTEVISDSEGADPASVTFNAISAAKSRNIDIAIVDTAGRLQNRVNLMNELEKIKRVASKARENGPDEIILVVDANNGQNALSQAVEFNKAVGLTGIVITKLDGSAKGGVIIGIAKELKLPIYYIGIGESAADLRKFNAEEFVEALFI